MSRKHLRWLGATPVLAIVTALAATGGAAAAPTATSAAGCTKATNVEAIIDDSGSMDFTDPAKNRNELINVMNSLNGNVGKKLGAVEFGDTADTLFPPTKIPIAQTTLKGAFALVNADNGLTDYQLAFNTGNSANPKADARLFLSDGEPTTGTIPPTSQLSPPTKTYTVGFGSSDPTLLAQIAKQTVGHAFQLTDSSQVPAVAAGVTALLNCKKPPVVFTKVFTKPGQAKGYSFKPLGRTADILVTWPPAIGTAINTINPKLALPPGVAATAKVSAKVKRGTSFVTVHLKGLKKGVKTKFKVKAKSLAGPTTVTTQVIR
jgi:hypothetical protein